MFRGSRTDELLTLIFMGLAIATIVCYFAVANKMVFFSLGAAAVVIRLIQYALRFFK